MFTSVKFFKDTTKSIILENSKKGYYETMLVVGELIDRNNQEDFDLFFKVRGKRDQEAIEAKTTNNYMDSQKNLLPAFMNPNTPMYMEKAFLPSPNYWGTINQEMDGSSKVETKSFSELIKGKPFSLQTFNENVPCDGHYKLVRISTYNFTINTKIPGLNQSKQNPNIFFSVSPNYGYEHQVIDLQIPELEKLEKFNQKGREYLADIIDQVKDLRPNNQISCIVLGNRSLNENMNAYETAHKLEEKQERIEQHIEHYFLPKEKSKAKVDVDVYNIDAYGHILNLTDQDLKTVHELAVSVQKKEGSDKSIIVHCQQGLDRTGMLIFAFILFEKYDYFFTGDKRADNIYAAYLTLLESRSPTALTKIPDLVNAIYLAHALKAIDLEKNCFINFNKLANKNKKDSSSALSLMKELSEATSYADKLIVLDNELIRIEKMQNMQTDKLRILDTELKPMEEKQTSQTDKLNILSTELKPEEKLENKQENVKHAIHKKRPNSLNYNSQSKSSIEEIKKSSSYPGDLHTFTEKKPQLEIKLKEGKPQKTSSGLFAKKYKKHQSDHMKESKTQNPSNKYVNELKYFRQVLQHSKDTNETLQDRIKPH